MRKMSYVKMTILTALSIALCVVLPMAFHAIPGAGFILLPMHIPVLLCGLICGWRFGLIAGVLGPLLSSLITGMPMAAFLPSMMVELGVYGLAAGFMIQVIDSKRVFADLYISLVCAMIIGRIIAGISLALIFSPGTYTMAAWITAFFVTSMPGMIIQLAFLPSIVIALEAAGLIPKRMQKG